MLKFQALIYKNVKFNIFARRKITDACLFVILFVCLSDQYNGPR